MTSNIRIARPEDCSAIATLNEHAQALHIAARPDVFKPTRLSELEPWFRALLRDTAMRGWLAELDGQPVGYVISILRVSEENPLCLARRWLELNEIAVAPEQRRQGIARALTEQVLAHARAEGLESVELGSWSFNAAAHAAFAQLGFSPQRVRFERRVE
ncbi:MAG TPA: GNAT family N-acetyltransferase [Polyangiaceae bacterium]|nr:GNAT family N-acetyltransferase [Polyangiaceae bacterium]